MFRFIMIALFFCATLPLVPHYLQTGSLFTGASQQGASDETEGLEEERAHRISKSRNGHYLADARINGHLFEMLVDTGASTVALPESVAEEAGIFLQPSDYKVPVRTANGVTYGGSAVIRTFQVGRIRLQNVEALILKDDALRTPLLGMSALNQLQRFDFSNDSLLLVQ